MRVIVVGASDSITGRAALRWASERAYARGAVLHVLKAVTDVTLVGSPTAGLVTIGLIDHDAREAARQQVRALVDRELTDRSLRPHIETLISGRRLSTALRDAAAVSADMVVAGVPRHRSTTRQLRRARRDIPCPLILIDDAHVH